MFFVFLALAAIASGAIASVAGFGIGSILTPLVATKTGLHLAVAAVSFEMSKESFVATATATGLVVDTARMPVYVVTRAHDLVGVWPLLLVGTIGTLGGTLAGERVLRKIPERTFGVIVIVLALGIYMLRG